MELTAAHWILLLAAGALAESPQLAVKLVTDATLVEPESTFHFNCTVKGLIGGSSFLHITKNTKLADDTTKTITLATNSILSDEAKTIGRYSTAYDLEKKTNTLTIIFTIEDARSEDSGEYACLVMGGNGVIMEDKQPITVVDADNFVIEMTVHRLNHPGEAPITFSSMSSDVHEYELEEPEPFHIIIHTSESNPPAELHMLAGDVDIGGQFVVTTTPSQFTDSADLLVGLKYAVSAEGRVQVDHSYRKGFHVTGKVADEVKSVGFAVKFSGSPPIIDENCPHSILAGRYQRNVNFECTITSEEPVEVYFYYFRPLEDGELEKVVIMPGDMDPSADYHYEASLYENREKMLYEVALNMPVMFPQMFTEYTLYVSNSKGDASHKVILEEDPDKSIVASGKASHPLVGVPTVLIFAISAVILHQL